MTTYEDFEKTLEFTPTPEQREVIVSEDHAIAVIAGAGSGKTATMAQRIVWHIVNGNVRPDEVLGLTFTTKAAGELAERVEEQLEHAQRMGLMPGQDRQVHADQAGNRNPRELGEDEQADAVADLEHAQMAKPTIATYNSFAADIASSYSMLIGEDPRARLITDAERWQIMREIVASVDSQTREFDVLKAWSANTVVRDALHISDALISNGVTTTELREVLSEEQEALRKLADVSVARGTHTEASKAQSGTPGSALQKIERRLALCTIVDSYLAYKKEHSLIEFADQVDRANRILKAVPEQVSELIGHYKLVLLDEYQDTSSQQAEFLYHAFSNVRSVCAVGDPNQAIYSWRGASAAALSDFMDRFRVPRNLTLSTAFRNGENILKAANALTSGKLSYPSMTVKKLVPRQRASEGEVRFIHRSLREDSYDAMAGQFAQIFDEARRKREGAVSSGESDAGAFPTAVVLCRARSYIDNAVKALEKYDVPFEIVGGEALIEKPEVRLLRAFLGLIAVPERHDLLVPIFTHFAIGVRDLQALAAFTKTLSRATTKEYAAQMGGSAVSGGKTGGESIEVRASLVEAIDALPHPDEGNGVPNLSATGHARLFHIRSLLKSLRKRLHLPVPDLITFAIDALDLPFYARSRRDGGARVEGALSSFVRMAAQYVRDNPRANLKGFTEWVDAVEEHENTGEGDVSGDAQLLETEDVVPESGVVQIMTVHGAKGLEWDVVAIPEMRYRGFDDFSRDKAWQLDGSALPFPLRADREHLPEFSFAKRCPEVITPHDKAPILEDFHEHLTGPLAAHYRAEQRRLAYVAVTRPRDILLLCSYDLQFEAQAGTKLKELEKLVAREEIAGPVPEACMPHNTFIADMESVLTADPANDRVLCGADLERIADESQESGTDVWDEIFAPDTKRWPVDIDRRLDRADLPPVRLSREELDHFMTKWEQEAHVLIQETQSSTTADPITREYLTASDVVKLSSDPESFVRDQRRPLPHRPSRAARTGTFVHEQIAHHYDAPLTLDVDSVADPDEMPIDSATEMTDAVRERLLSRFHRSPYAACPKIAIEEAVDIELGGRPIRCVIDAVLDTSGLEGHPPVTIVDWKTGPRPGPEQVESRQYQLALYRLAWSVAQGIPLGDIGAVFYYLGEPKEDQRALHAPIFNAKEIAEHIEDQLAEGVELAAVKPASSADSA
ncbi:DNA helicase-2/ATP-dependent DNA helicase PcrA [Trueperella bonasi]|uniref:DNA 3'-5' helicase n=1 Tax=Trueperella bonasi TaxID=312286 RepID=A0ABT9NG10_9ACTO|nr:ATP-dependent DNA helicase [Trueperella bonasi]MDP9805773.1 DNA helicase-2/ATP-dependent DNA helicase PcrA [Trueperella bonasi]